MLLTQFAASRYLQWTSGKFFQAAIEKGLAQVELIRLALRSVANYFERLIALTREAEYIKASKSCRMSNRNSPGERLSLRLIDNTPLYFQLDKQKKKKKKKKEKFLPEILRVKVEFWHPWPHRRYLNRYRVLFFFFFFFF